MTTDYIGTLEPPGPDFELEREKTEAGGWGYTDESLLLDLARVANLLGHAPTAREYNEYGLSCSTTFVRSVGWDNALERIGLQPNDSTGPRVGSQEILYDLAIGYECLGRWPSSDEYNDCGEYSHMVASERFGSWADAITAAKEYRKRRVELFPANHPPGVSP